MTKSNWTTMLAVGALFIASVAGTAVTGASTGSKRHDQAPVTITFDEAMGGNFGKELSALTNEFHREHPNITVQLIFTGTQYSTLQEKLTSALAAHQPPTIAQVKETWETEFYKDHLLQPLGPLLPKSTTADIMPVWRQDSSYNGQLVSVPFNKSAYVLYYNTDDFKKAGLTAPPTTWAQLERDAILITKKTGIPGFGMHADYYTFEMLMKQAGGHVLNPQQTKAGFENAAGLRALEFMSTLALKDKAAEVVSANAYITDGFNLNQYAMDFDSSAAIAYLTNPALHYKAAPLPMGVRRAVSSGGTNVVLFAGATPAQKAAATTFINFLISVPSTIAWAEHTGYLPVRQSALSNPAWMAYIGTHPNQAVAPEQVRFAYFTPRLAAMNSAIQEVTSQVGDMLEGSQTVTQTLHNMAQAVNEALG